MAADLWSIGLNYANSQLINADQFDELLDCYPISEFRQRCIRDVELLLTVWQSYLLGNETYFSDEQRKSGWLRYFTYLKNLSRQLETLSGQCEASTEFPEICSWFDRAATDFDLRLITLNYDTILERALEKVGRDCAYFQQLAASPGAVPYRKLHGSTNWYAMGHMANVHIGNALPDSVADSHAFFALESRFVSGANWFYWIAGLSLVNSVLMFTEAGWSFVIGLGVTQLIDAIAAAIAQEMAGAATGIKLVAFALDLVVAGVFLGFGALARKRFGWAFLVGMVIYAFDGLLFLLFEDLLSIGFHVFALICIWGGYKALRELNQMGPMTAPSTGMPLAAPEPPEPAG